MKYRQKKAFILMFSIILSLLLCVFSIGADRAAQQPKGQTLTKVKETEQDPKLEITDDINEVIEREGFDRNYLARLDVTRECYFKLMNHFSGGRNLFQS